jgi:GTPase SAR1 family protein
MSEVALDHIFKILLVGDAGVGKSSILLQFTDGQFDENLQSTIGVDFKVKIVEATGPDGLSKTIKANIWDTGTLPLAFCFCAVKTYCCLMKWTYAQQLAKSAFVH